MPKQNKLLIQGDYPLIASPTLAKVLGVAAATFLQKLHYCLESSDARIYQRKKFFFHSYEQWVETLGFYSVSTIKRVVSKLKNAGVLVIKKLASNKWLQTNFYSIDYKQLKKLLTPQVAKSTSDERNYAVEAHEHTDHCSVNSPVHELPEVSQKQITIAPPSIIPTQNQQPQSLSSDGSLHPLQPTAPFEILQKMPQEARFFYHMLRQQKVDIHYDDARLIEWLPHQKYLRRQIAFIKESFGHLRHHWYTPEQLGLRPT